MNCHECIYVSQVAGSAHKSCSTLEKLSLDKNIILKISFLLLSGKIELTYVNDEERRVPIIEIDEYGKKQGWANWPLDFDPVWVKKCGFFSSKKQ